MKARHDTKKLHFPYTKGYGRPVYDYDVCTTPAACGGCLQQRHLKSECKRLVMERIDSESQSSLFGGF